MSITLPCADCGAPLTYDVGNAPTEPCCAACVSTREGGAPMWVAAVPPLLILVGAFVAALLHVRTGGVVSMGAMAWPIGKMSPTLNWRRLAYVQDHSGVDFRDGIEEGSRAQTSAVRSQWFDRAWTRDARPEDEPSLSSAYPMHEEPEHGLDYASIWRTYAYEHAPTDDRAFALDCRYEDIEEIGL